MINKKRFSINKVKKVLHKIGKYWAVISTAILGLFTGGTMVANNAHANVQNNQNSNQANHETYSEQQNNKAQLVSNQATAPHSAASAQSHSASVATNSASLRNGVNNLFGNAIHHGLTSNAANSASDNVGMVAKARLVHTQTPQASNVARTMLGAATAANDQTQQLLPQEHVAKLLNLQNFVNVLNEDVKPNTNSSTHSAASNAYSDLMSLASDVAGSNFSTNMNVGDLSTPNTWLGDLSQVTSDIDAIRANGNDPLVTSAADTLNSVTARVDSKFVNLRKDGFAGIAEGTPDNASYIANAIIGSGSVGNGLTGYVNGKLGSKVAAEIAAGRVSKSEINKIVTMTRGVNSIMANPTMKSDYQNIISAAANLPNDNEEQSEDAFSDIDNGIQGIASGLNANPTIANDLSAVGNQANSLASSASESIATNASLSASYSASKSVSLSNADSLAESIANSAASAASSHERSANSANNSAQNAANSAANNSNSASNAAKSANSNSDQAASDASDVAKDSALVSSEINSYAMKASGEEATVRSIYNEAKLHGAMTNQYYAKVARSATIEALDATNEVEQLTSNQHLIDSILDYSNAAVRINSEIEALNTSAQSTSSAITSMSKEVNALSITASYYKSNASNTISNPSARSMFNDLASSDDAKINSLNYEINSMSASLNGSKDNSDVTPSSVNSNTSNPNDSTSSPNTYTPAQAPSNSTSPSASSYSNDSFTSTSQSLNDDAPVYFWNTSNSASATSKSTEAASVVNAKDLNQLSVGQTMKSGNETITRVANNYHWFSVDKTCLAHNHIDSVGEVKDYGAILRPSATVRIEKVFRVNVNGQKFYRYEVKIDGHSYYVTGNASYTREAYYQPRNLAHKRLYGRVGHRYYKAMIKTPCLIYDNPHYTKDNELYKIRRGNVINVRGLISIGRKSHRITRFELTDGTFITANQYFIKLL